MAAPPFSPAEGFWRSRAARLALKLNFHHWLSQAVAPLLVVAGIFTVLELFRREASLPASWALAFLLLGSAVAGGWAWLRARRHFCGREQALVRLETTLAMHNRLSAASAGVVAWPAIPAVCHDGYLVNWKLIGVPLILGCAFALAAHLIPIHHFTAVNRAGSISEPLELAQVQTWLDALKNSDAIEPDRLQEIQASLNQLRDRPPQDWYAQSNLEAANSLKELTEQSMNTLAHDLDQADQAVQSMKNSAGSSSGASLKPMQDELRKAAANLSSGNLPLNRELVDQLTGAETAMDKTLSASQLKALHDRLQRGKSAAQTAPRTGGGLSGEVEKALADGQAGGGGRRRVGSGGKGGGKQSAPLELQAREKSSPDGALTPVNSHDMSRAALGETLKVTAGNQNVDPTAYKGTQNAGVTQVQGDGGEAVWRSTYDPQDADTLARFFK